MEIEEFAGVRKLDLRKASSSKTSSSQDIFKVSPDLSSRLPENFEGIAFLFTAICLEWH